MANLVASTFVGNGSLQLFLDNQVLMNDSDTLTFEIQEGEAYTIHWFVRAAPGSAYSITVSSPQDAQFQLTRVVGKTGKDFGGYQFQN